MRPWAALPVAVLVASWGVVYLPPIVLDRTLPARDLGATHLPWRTEWARQVSAGTLPLWDPASNHGRLLLANPNAMAAYPGTALFLLLPPEIALVSHIALHHLVLLLGCYVVARRAGFAASTASVAAAGAAGCGVVWSCGTFLNAQAALAWAPWALATAVPARQGGRDAARSGLVGGALVGLCFLAGEPVTAALTGLAWIAVSLSHAPRWQWQGPAALLSSALAVAAPVLIPLLASYSETSRGALGIATGALAADALAPRRWLELLFPSVLGPPLADAASGFWAAPSFPWQRYYPVVFTGSLPLLLLPLARRAGRPTRVWWCLAAVGLTLAVLLGWSGLATSVQRFPGIASVRFAIKFLLLAFLALPVLLAAGWEALRAAGPRRQRKLALALLTPVLVAWLAAGPLRTPARVLLGSLYPASAGPLARAASKDIVGPLAVDGAALALVPAGLLALGASAVPLAGVTLVSNALLARGVLQFDDARRWAVPPPAFSRLPARPRLAALAPRGDPSDTTENESLRRFWAMRAALVASYGTRWGAGYGLTRGPDGLEPALQEFLAAQATRLPARDRVRVAAALGITAAITDSPVEGVPGEEVDGIWVTRITGHARDVYLASRLIPAQGAAAALDALASTAFRAGLDAVVEGQGGVREMAGGDVTEMPGAPHCRRVRTVSGGPSLLVVEQSYLSSWRAEIDGAAAPVEVANGAMIGVRIPAGDHAVKVFLDPRPYRVGACGPLVVVAAFILLQAGGASRGRSAASGGGGRSSPATPPEQ